MTKGIGILGGTFDPIHYGHLVCAEAAREQFKLERVIFIPAARPPHKDLARLTPALHRFNMTVLATISNPYFEVSAVELRRPGLSYTIDTLRQLRRQFGPAAEFYFITGVDALAGLLSWRDPAGLLAETRFIAAERPGYPGSLLNELLAQLTPAQRERIHRIQIPAVAISSTELRRRVRAGLSIKYLVPETVEQYIVKNRLYREPRD
mgnify:CR=1 FL=1